MVNINTVYQRVLTIANKEQRGYITPQEFNILANQAQLDIFEQYFYDINQFLRLPGNDTIASDPLDMLEEKVSIFEKFDQTVTMGSLGVGTIPTEAYRLMNVTFLSSNGVVDVQHINKKELNKYQNSKLTAPTETRPFYITTSENGIKILPTTITSNVKCNYVAKPATVRWGYAMINNEALYNPSNSTNFELHESEESDLVIKILALAGIVIKDPQLYQIAAGADTAKQQLEKQ